MFIAALIVAAILTLLIFSLAILAFHSFLKAAKQEIASGQQDENIRKEAVDEKKKSSKILDLISKIISTAAIVALFAISVTAIAYRASGEQLSISDTTALVIVSNSMDGFHDSSYQKDILQYKMNAEQDQFAVGDLVVFKTVKADEELIQYDVYGYKAKNGKTITHRYIGTTDNGQYIFRGDNTGGRDSYVDREQIVLHYSNVKIQRVGYFILFTQSGYGLYSFISSIMVYIIADIYLAKYIALRKSRLACIDAIEEAKAAPELPCAPIEEKQAEVSTEAEQEQKQIIMTIPKRKKLSERTDLRLVEFTTSEGRHVKFYIKRSEAKK